MVLFVASVAISILLNPLAGLGFLVVAFVIGFVAVYSINELVLAAIDYGSDKTARSITLGIVGTLVSEGNTRGASPSFISASSRRGGEDFMQRLERTPAYRQWCGVVSLLGPVPCYPAVSWLERLNDR
jgi:hypothetical protein